MTQPDNVFADRPWPEQQRLAAKLTIPPRATLRVERDTIDVTPIGPQPDPDWTYTDRAGHTHRMVKGRDSYPTLRVVEDDTYWCSDCDDDHTREHLECAQCGETIVPGTRTTAWRERIPGETRYWLGDEQITEAEFRAAVAVVSESRGGGPQRCGRCGRTTTDVALFGAEDRMTQPDGYPCGGRFAPVEESTQ